MLKVKLEISIFLNSKILLKVSEIFVLENLCRIF